MHCHFMSVVTILLLVAPARTDEVAAVEQISKLGGSIIFDEELPGNPVIAVDLTFKRLADTDLKTLREFKHLKSLNLSSTEITDEGLKIVKDLKGLTQLDISSCKKITAAGLKELRELKHLTILGVGSINSL